MSSTTTCDYSSLSNLMEAATALTALTAPITAKAPAVVRPVVIDDDNKPTDSKALKKKDIFPQKLMEILSDPTLTDIITWLPHGRSFVMIRPDMFTEKVLPKYMPPVDSRTSTKYPSFTRKLNRWGFRQATRGPDTGAFHHELFRRDQPELCLEMVCQKSRDNQAVRRALTEKKDTHSKVIRVEERVVSDSSNSSSDSGDESSSISSGLQCNEESVHSRLPSSITAGTVKGCGAPLPFISNDAKFVAQTLLQRERDEILKASKAMLYDAFMKASEDSKRI